MNSALLLAHALTKFHPPSVFPHWRVLRGTLNISPCHMNHDIVVLICLMQPGGGGESVLRIKSWLGDNHVQIEFFCPYLGPYSTCLGQQQAPMQ